MVNKKYIEKSYTFPSGVTINCFVITWYMKTFKNDTINFKIDGYKDKISFNNNLDYVELPIDINIINFIEDSLLVIGSGHEEKILNYLITNEDFFNNGIIKTL